MSACRITVKTLPALLCVLALSGCASQVQLERKVSIAATDAVVLDGRTAEQRAGRRDSNFSAVSFMADDRFVPRALDLFVDALVSQAGTTITKPLKVEIDEFRVVDFFPLRLGAGGQGWLGKIIFESLVDRNTDWSFVDATGVQRDKDSIVCVVVGRINGVPIRAAASDPYQISSMAALVVNDPDYRRAMDVSIKRAASQALIQLAR